MEFTEEIEKLLNRKVARMQKWVLDSLEDGTRLRWQLYYTSSNTLTEEGLFNQISKLEFLADEGSIDYHKAHCLLHPKLSTGRQPCTRQLSLYQS
jgi:hypothetical protein